MDKTDSTTKTKARKRAYYLANREYLLGKRKQWRKDHPERDSATRALWQKKRKLENAKFKRMKKYGINQEQYEMLLLASGHRCQICGVMFEDKPHKGPHIDHNHMTGKIRGILCKTCNNGLGFFKDSQLFLSNAIKYLADRG